MTIFLLSHVFLVPQKGETTTEKCESKNLCYFLFQLIILNYGTGGVKVARMVN